jgi:hypothetical protein
MQHRHKYRINNKATIAFHFPYNRSTPTLTGPVTNAPPTPGHINLIATVCRCRDPHCFIAKITLVVTIISAFDNCPWLRLSSLVERVSACIVIIAACWWQDVARWGSCVILIDKNMYLNYRVCKVGVFARNR